MPALEQVFATQVVAAVDLALAGERIRASVAIGSITRTELTIVRLEALYESAFLRAFLAWEEFLEETFLRYLCGYHSKLGPCSLLGIPHKNIAGANAAVLGGNSFVSWADPDKVVKRSKRFMNAGFHETVLNSDLSRLILFKDIRNRIAHSSEYARMQFDTATRALALKRYPGSSPGRFLRDRGQTLPIPKSWLELITDELKALSKQICTM